MPTLSQPELLPGPFAYNGDKNDIPDASASLGAASYQQGFPPITQLPVNAGGIPPQRNDFNGILNALSQHTFWQQSGGMYAWSATLDYAVPSMVVGSDKELYFALQPSGPGTAAGAKNPTSGAGKAYWQNIAYVLPVATATKLGGVMVNKGGLQVSASGLLSLLLMQGGGLNLNAAGQLYVDTADFSEEMLRAFLEGIIADGGGLGFDSSGKLYVDADAFSDDLLERFLKSIRVPIWLTRNKSFYVNITTGSDTLDEGRGESAGKPFKTIQACVDYICDNYNISRYVATINIANGTYGSVSCPDFSRTTGYIRLHGDSADGVEVNATGAGAIWVTGGLWYIDNITAVSYIKTVPEGSGWVEYNVIGANSYAEVHISSNVTAKLIAPASVTHVAIGTFRGLLVSNNAIVYIDDLTIIGQDDTNGAIAKSHFQGVSGYSGGAFTLMGPVGGTALTINGVFANVVFISGASFSRNTVRNAFVAGEASGVRYRVFSGGHVMINGGGPDFFPGDTAGTVETSTYSWYK